MATSPASTINLSLHHHIKSPHREQAVWSRYSSEGGVQAHAVVCELCSRSFRKESDKKRHKCVDERLSPVCEQRDAVQCPQCQRCLGVKVG